MLYCSVQRLDGKEMKQILIFGLGYTASRLSSSLEERGWRINATGKIGNLDFSSDNQIKTAINEASHILSSVPPNSKTGNDPVLERYGAFLNAKWIGYLSSTGVYGDTQGAWVDESTPTIFETGKGRRNARAAADAEWLKMGARVFRLPGIYGPGRSALDRVRQGTAKRINLPNQIFSRIHVDDIVSAVISAIEKEAPAGSYNLSDNHPSNGNLVIEKACSLLGLELPEMQSLSEADLTEASLGFYKESRRVANRKAKRVLQWEPRYSSYREGLVALSGV